MQRHNYILKFIGGPMRGKSIIVSEKEYTLGREATNSIRMNDKLVSKHHCKILKTDNGLFISDLASKNGTFLNEFRIQPDIKYPLHPGSEIEIGQSTMHVVFEEAGFDGEEITQAPAEKITGTPAHGGGVQSEPYDSMDRTTIPFPIDSSRNLVAIYRLLNTVVGTTDKATLANETMDLVMDTLRPERGFLFFREDLDEQKLVPRIKKSRYGKNESSAVISRTVIDKVLEDGDAIISTKPADDERFSGAKSIVNYNINSIACAPIKTKSRFHGIIYLDSTSSTVSFKKDDVELLTALGIQLGIMLENINLISDFQDLFLGVIKTLVTIIETKDEYTLGHSERVTKISLAIGEKMGLSHKEMETLHVAALLHDIGKIAIPEEILKKPGTLTDVEYSKIKRHPSIGTSLVHHLKNFDEISKGILYHHERYDGKGYPSGASGDDIPLIARIIAVADTFDAMTSDRAYRTKLSDEEAVEEIFNNQEKQFDAKVVNVFHELYKTKKIPSPEEKFPSIMNLKKMATEL